MVSLFLNISPQIQHFKGALSRYSVFLCRFFVVKNGGKETRGRRAGQQEAGLCRTCFFFTCSELHDRSTSAYQSVTLAKSCLSRRKLGFEIIIKKVKAKRKVCPEQWWKIHGIQNGLQSSTDRSWAVLVRRSFKTRDLSGAVVYISLHSTMYTTTIDRRMLGRTFVERASFGKMPRHGRHYFSPQQNGAKNHWIAWQCTFNCGDPLRNSHAVVV